MKRIKGLIIIVLSLFIFFPLSLKAEEHDVNFYLFYGRECPHCEELMEWLDVYMNENKNINLYKYEVWHSDENANKFLSVCDVLDTESASVPFLVIGEDYIVGFSSLSTPEDINRLFKKYEQETYRDKVGETLGVVKKSNEKEKTDLKKEVKEENKEQNKKFDVPILGEIDAKDVSLPFLAVVLGFVDGFNPCALWVLIFLITMLLGMKDRKKMWALGITFLVTSALVYTLFMVSWLSFALFMGKVNIIKILVGTFAVIFGVYNILRFIKSFNKDTGCDVVNDSKRKKIINKIKSIVHEKSFFVALLGVIVLAFSVNLIELMCSLGLPVVYTEVLSMNNLTIAQYAICIFIYILFYLLDDLIIFIIAMKTLKIKAISNKYLKYSHLIGGLIMLALGILMIYKPEWLMLNF